MPLRQAGYTQEEDKLLCLVYMEISQDPIKGVYQTSEIFWSRVMEAYENGKNASWSERTMKRPSGASSDDIFNQAKLMLKEDPNYKGGWKFDHIWNIIKNFEKFKDGEASSRNVSNSCGFGHASSDSENPTPESGIQVSQGMSSFSLNLEDDEDITGASPSQRPIGVKKSKLKRKSDDQTSLNINTLEEGNSKLLEQLKKTSSQRQHHLDIQSKNYALKELKEENRILFQDANSIQDPNIRAYVQAQQAIILQKRSEQQQNEQPPPTSSSYGQYFTDLS